MGSPQRKPTSLPERRSGEPNDLCAAESRKEVGGVEVWPRGRLVEVAAAYFTSAPKLPHRMERTLPDGLTVFPFKTSPQRRLRSNALRLAVASLSIKHCFTRPDPPKTNGQAERFIQTSLQMKCIFIAPPYNTGSSFTH
ncbi:MAG: hypothetical protein WCI46_15915 [Verrucomicrobiota bacterium]